MKLIIEWKDENKWGEAQTTFPDIDPQTIAMEHGLLGFGTEGYEYHWVQSMNDIKSFHFEN